MCETCETWERLWQEGERRLAEWFARQSSGDPTPFVKPGDLSDAGGMVEP